MRQVCAVGAKNLAEVESRTEAGLREATNDLRSLLFNFAWWLKKQGYAESTIESKVWLLRILAKRGADLHDPESVKEVIARQSSWCAKRKANAVDAYTSFLRMIKKTWEPPIYRFAKKLPFIPTERELDDLIAGCGPKTATFLQLLKETGMRAGEAHNLRWEDIDFKTGTVRVTPEKGSEPRIFRLSQKLINMLVNLRRTSRVSDPSRVFAKDLRTIRKIFEKQRAKIARKLQNPRLRRIHFHTFRHWKATVLYHQTKDILYVMKFLGHKNIKNTLIYVQLEEALFPDEPERYICRVATSLKEAKELIEQGFQYVCDFQGAKLFRKPDPNRGSISGAGASIGGAGGI